MDSNSFYVQLSGVDRFEKINETAFNDRAFALNSEGRPRYNALNWIMVTGGIVQMNLTTGVPTRLLADITRMLGIPASTGAVMGGFCSEPTHINFKKGRSEFLLDLENDCKWKKAA